MLSLEGPVRTVFRGFFGSKSATPFPTHGRIVEPATIVLDETRGARSREEALRLKSALEPADS